MKETLPSLGSDVVMVSLDIDPNESAEMLKRYADQNGFDWRFAVASRDTARQLGELYGTQFTTPPSEPMLVIDRAGTPHPLPFGRKNADALRRFITQYR